MVFILCCLFNFCGAKVRNLFYMAKFCCLCFFSTVRMKDIASVEEKETGTFLVMVPVL